VLDAAVVTKKKEGEERIVIGVVSVRDSNHFSVTKVRERLSRDLPFYACPSILLQCERFPMTGSGKVDRQAVLEKIDSYQPLT